MNRIYAQAIKLPAEAYSHSAQVITLAPLGQVMLAKPIPAPHLPSKK